MLSARSTYPTAPSNDGATASAAEHRPAISLIVALDVLDAGCRRSLSDMLAIVDSAAVEIVVAPREPWPDAPKGIRVVAFDSASRGDRYDHAAESALGSLLAFSDARMRLPAGWSERVVRVFADPTTAIAGGPVLPRSWWRAERISALILNRRVGATPGGHLARQEQPGSVSELAGSNLIIRRELFWAVGGFQSPSVGGEAVRLCYKVRSLMDRPITYAPTLAVRATARRFPGSFLAEIASFGRARGDLARRSRELAPFIPYGLPTVAVALVATEIALLALRRWDAALLAGALLLAGYLIQAVSVLVGSGRLSDRLLASLALPLVPLTYGSAFIGGYLGPSQGEVSPRRSRPLPLQILIVNWRDVSHPRAGGAEVYMHEIGQRWARDGMEVSWLCQRHSRSAKHEVIDGIAMHRVGGRFSLYPLVVLTYILQLHGRYDVIIDCENGIPFFSPLFARVPSVLVVHHVHTTIFRREMRPPLRWLGLWLEGWLMPRVYRNRQAVAVSESTRDDLVALGFRSERIAIVHNGVHSLPEVPPQPSRHPTLLCIGRLAPQKCVDVLIRAMPTVLRAYPDTRLEIVGQGPDRTRLERVAWSLNLAHHVRFHGYLPTPARDMVMAQAWVSVCSSAYEGWGIACVEASARGLPVIASNVNGLRDAVRDGETGILVPHGDPEALAAALVELIGDPDKRGRMGAAGWRWATEHSWDKSASDLREVVLSVPSVARTAARRSSRTAHEISAERQGRNAPVPR